MGDYSGYGSSPRAGGKVDLLQVAKADHSKLKRVVTVEKSYKPTKEEIAAERSEKPGEKSPEKASETKSIVAAAGDIPKPAEGSFHDQELRRRQRSLLGSLLVEETKVEIAGLPVLDVKRVAHVKFDQESQRFVGLPPEWEAAVATNFGLPLALCKSTKVAGYRSRIPNVLLKMAEYLRDRDAASVKGIFRIAPDQAERDLVLEQLANDTFTGCKDVHCVSTGIKVWFRELPSHIFRGLNEDRIKACDTDDEAAAILSTLQEPALSVLEWLMDLANWIIANCSVNLMTAKNMSIVITPNLYKVKETGDPNDMLFLAKKFTDFFERCLNNRARQKAQSQDAEAEESKNDEPTGEIEFTIDLDSAEASLRSSVGSPKAKTDTASPTAAPAPTSAAS